MIQMAAESTGNKNANVADTYLNKDDHIPNCFDQSDVRTTLAQLLVLWETDLKEISGVLQLLHVGLHHRNSLI